jgi:T5SS/PEP-CTERM-associated repeat protein
MKATRSATLTGVGFFAAVGILAPTVQGQYDYSLPRQTNVISGLVSNWAGNGTYVVGSNTFLNALLIINGGVLSNGYGEIGFVFGGSNNVAIVSGPGSVWSNQLDLHVGRLGAGNQLVISNGGAVYNGNYGILGFSDPSSNNTATVTGTGSVWSNGNNLYIGYIGAGNTLIVSNGGAVFNNDGLIGSLNPSSNNSVRVVDNATWRNNGALEVGILTSSNTLTIAGGSVTASNAFIGVVDNILGTASNNVIRVDSGSLFVTNALGTGSLVVSLAGGKASLILNGGSVTADSLIATNGVNSVVALNGGSLHVKGTAVDDGIVTLNTGVCVANGDVVLGSTAGATGNVWLTDSQLIINGTTCVGSNGVAQMTVSNGTWLATNVFVGQYSGSQGTLTMAGGNRELSGLLSIGYAAGATGTVWVTGGTLTGSNSETVVGYFGVGSMTVSNATWLASDVFVADTSISQGTLTLVDETVEKVVLGSDLRLLRWPALT